MQQRIQGPSPSQDRVLFFFCKKRAQASGASCRGIEAHRARLFHLSSPHVKNTENTELPEGIQGNNSNCRKHRRKRRSKVLLSDDDVRRWYENLCRSSKLNADVYLRRLRLFCEQRHTTPSKLAAIGTANAKQVEDMLHDHVQQLETVEYAPSYVKGVLKAVKPWLSYNYVELKHKIIIMTYMT